MLSMGGEQHRRYRALVQPSFVPANAKWWIDNWITETVDLLIDGFVHDGRAELNVDFCAAIPVLTITGSFGIPVEQALDIREALRERSAEGGRHTQADRRRPPRGAKDDLISVLVQAELTDEDGVTHRLTDREIDSFVLLLLGAGSGTTWKQMGITLTTLLQRPDVLEAVRADRQLLRAAIEESLRWMPTDPMFSRWVMADTELGGVEIPAGPSCISRSAPPTGTPPAGTAPMSTTSPESSGRRWGSAGRAHLPRHARRPRRDDHRDLGAARPAAEPAAGSRRRTAPLRRHVRARGDRHTRALR